MWSKGIPAGLRIDVDTLRGTRLGVVNLLPVLSHFGIKATFFFTVGPDNMGRHLRRLIHPAFLGKMLRSRAASLYGMDIILRGTLWPGPIIGTRCKEVIRQAAEEGHEIGLHAWDHHQWQVNVATMAGQEVKSVLHKGMEMMKQITGNQISCSAAPGWRCTDTVLYEKEKLSFRYNSDCRGRSIFLPVVRGNQLKTPQIPTTLPTYDELIGRKGVTRSNYNSHLLSFFKKDRLNVLTIHAEAEGISCVDMFQDFIVRAQLRGIDLQPLGELLSSVSSFKSNQVVTGQVEGREGWISCQAEQTEECA